MPFFEYGVWPNESMSIEKIISWVGSRLGQLCIKIKLTPYVTLAFFLTHKINNIRPSSCLFSYGLQIKASRLRKVMHIVF